MRRKHLLERYFKVAHNTTPARSCWRRVMTFPDRLAEQHVYTNPLEQTFSAPTNVVSGSLWLLMCFSSIVFIEPAPFDLMAAGMIATFFAFGLRVPVGLGWPVLLVSLFILSNLISIVFASPNVAQPLPYMTFYAALTVYLIVLWLFFTSIIAVDPEKTLRILWSGYMVAAVIAVILGLAGYFRLVPNPELFLKMGRAKGAFKDANVFGPFLIPVALYLLADMRGRRPLAVLLRMGLFLFFALGLLIAFSRGAWGNLIVSAAVLAVLFWLKAATVAEYARMMLGGLAIVAATAAIVLLAISSPQVGEMFERRASLLQSYDVEQGGRFSTQMAAIRQIARNPVGLGPNRTQSELGRVPHNVYLKIAAENGWLGGITFVAFIGLTLWRGWQFALRPSPIQSGFAVAYASTVGIVAESVIIDTMHWRHFFLLLAMIWGPIVAYERYGVTLTNTTPAPGANGMN